MSEQRIADVKITVTLPRQQGKKEHCFVKTLTVRGYVAEQFRRKHNRLNRNFYPTVPIKREEKEEWYRTMYRVKIGDKWLKTGKSKYEFYTREEVFQIANKVSR